jgi:hypothetical protein
MRCARMRCRRRSLCARARGAALARPGWALRFFRLRSGAARPLLRVEHALGGGPVPLFLIRGTAFFFPQTMGDLSHAVLPVGHENPPVALLRDTLRLSAGRNMRRFATRSHCRSSESRAVIKCVVCRDRRRCSTLLGWGARASRIVGWAKPAEARSAKVGVPTRSKSQTNIRVGTPAGTGSGGSQCQFTAPFPQVSTQYTILRGVPRQGDAS